MYKLMLMRQKLVLSGWSLVCTTRSAVPFEARLYGGTNMRRIPFRVRNSMYSAWWMPFRCGTRWYLASREQKTPAEIGNAYKPIDKLSIVAVQKSVETLVSNQMQNFILTAICLRKWLTGSVFALCNIRSYSSLEPKSKKYSFEAFIINRGTVVNLLRYLQNNLENSSVASIYIKNECNQYLPDLAFISEPSLCN